LLRPLEGSHATWEVPSDDPDRMQLLVLGPARRGEEGEQRTAFERLLNSRTSLLHPHLAAVVDGGESPRGPYIVCALPRSRPLSAIVGDGSMDPAATHRLLTGVADGLDAAHARWLIHTDLTPRTIFVESGPRDWAWLTDFGIAHNRSPLAFARAGYRSPEELRGGAPVPESNVYSLACVVHTCLAGTPPFARPSGRAAMEAQLEQSPPRLSQARPDLPQAIDDVLMAALDRDPGRRPKTAGLLIQQVGAALGVLDPDALANGNGRRTARFRRSSMAPPRPVPVNKQKPVSVTTGTEAPARRRTAPGKRSERRGSAVPAPTRRVPVAQPLPPRRRARRAMPGVVLLGLLGLALGAGGFAGWTLGGEKEETGPDPAVAARAQRAADQRANQAVAAEAERVAWLGSANTAVGALNQSRAANRGRLAGAERPAGQVERARALAAAYAAAAQRLGQAPASVTAAPAAVSALRRAERAYGRLASAAGNENRSAYRRAVSSIRSAERTVDSTLARLGEAP